MTATTIIIIIINVSPIILNFTKINPLKTYEKSFLFYPICTFGSSNMQMLGGN